MPTAVKRAEPSGTMPLSREKLLTAPGPISPTSRFLLRLYDLFLLTGAVMILPGLFPLIWSTEKYRQTVACRLWLGRPDGWSPPGHPAPRLWIHALSVGEIHATSALVLIIRESYPSLNIVLSVSTLTGYQTARRLFNQQQIPILFFPYDFSFSVRTAARWVRPSAVILTETDIWPNFLAEMRRRAVPVHLINLRLSDQTFKRYGKFKWFARKLFGSFASVCVQSEEDARRLVRLGMDSQRVHVTGNIKFDSEPVETAEDISGQWRNRLGLDLHCQVVVAGSTHPDDEDMLLQAHTTLWGEGLRFLLVIAPRDPVRSAQTLDLFRSRGLVCKFLSELPMRDARKTPDVVIVDSIGILKQLYALADLTFIGGSMGRDGGHNPLEPAAYGKPILFGPDMSDFRQIAQWLVQSGGATMVNDAAEMIDACRRLLGDEDSAQAMGHRALGVFRENQGAVLDTLQCLHVPNLIAEA